MCRGKNRAKGARFQERKRLAAESKKCRMNSQQLAFVFVVDEARILEPVHEKANARPRGAHHLCQRLMTHLRNRSLCVLCSILCNRTPDQ